jgi:hypothetical protein
MTDAQLEGIAAQALNLARLDLERGKFNFLVACYHDGRGLHRMSTLESDINAKLGEGWLNSGETKDAAFGLFRFCVDILPPDAFIFVSVGNEFRPTAKLLALDEAKRLEIIGAGHDRHHRAVAEGLMTVRDVLQAVAQTPTQVCLRRQPCTPRGMSLDEPPTTRMMPQDRFSGRLKMYGDPNAQTLGVPPQDDRRDPRR